MATAGSETALIIGISGGTSSGKTTLSRLLRTIFHNLTIPFPPASPSSPSIKFTTTILHQDDFFLQESVLPIRRIKYQDKDGTMIEQDLRDWDCPQSINFPALKEALKLFRASGTLSRKEILQAVGVEDKEDTNSVGPENVPTEVIEEIKALAVHQVSEILNVHGSLTAIFPGIVNLIILDGFLLYHENSPEYISHAQNEIKDPQVQDSPLLDLLDLCLLLRTNCATAATRRTIRMSYVTLEDFWDDPPGYFQEIVWPNYVKYHGHLFVDGDVERGGLTEVARREGIYLQPERGDGEVDLGEVVSWSCGKVVEVVKRRVRGGVESV